MSRECKVCGSCIDSGEHCGVCSNCYKKILNVHGDIFTSFLAYAKDNLKYDYKDAVSYQLERFTEDKALLNDMIGKCKNIIINKNMTDRSLNHDYDTFQFIEELLLKISKEDKKFEYAFINRWNAIQLWNGFLEENEGYGIPYKKCKFCGEYKVADLHYTFYRDEQFLCRSCYEENVDHIIKVLFEYILFAKKYCNKIDIIDKYDSTTLAYKTFKNMPEFKVCAGDELFPLLYRIIIDEFPNINEPKEKFYALWNSYIRSGSKLVNNSTYYNLIQFSMGKKCSRCTSEMVDYWSYKDYQSMMEGNYLCDNCNAWIKILDLLNEEFGWNREWRMALNEYEDYSIKNSPKQADLNDLNRLILRPHGIPVTQDIIEGWNKIFDQLSGRHIIKFYAFDDGLAGSLEQTVGRFAGGLARGLSNLFK